MPFFSFSIKEMNSSFVKFNITSNKVYFSKNTELWKKLIKEKSLKLNFLRREKRHYINIIGKKILFYLPPSIGLGDVIEYATAIKEIKESNNFNKVGVAFTGECSFIFQDIFKIEIVYPYVVEESELRTFDTFFHLTLQIKSLITQKYLRSNICQELCNFFNIKDPRIRTNKQIQNQVKKISIFPLSSSPVRTMPIKILNDLINLLIDNFFVEIFLDESSEVSNYIEKHINNNKVILVKPKRKKELISLIQDIQYGVFMDSGPLHVAKMFNKRGILLESSVSNKILLENYSLIKPIENNFFSNFCKAPCGLTDIFNYNNNFGCYDILKIKRSQFIKNKFENMTARGVKNNYLKYIKNPPGCLLSLNVQNIYNIIKRELLL